MKILRILLIVIIIVGLVLTGILIIKKKRAELAKAKPLAEKAMPVTVVSVKKGTFILEKQYVGIVTSPFTADVSSRITAEIKNIYTREGDNVKKGDLLIKLDDRNLKQQISVLEAKKEGVKVGVISNQVKVKSLKSSVNYWNKQIERNKQLLDKNILSAKDYELTEEKLNEIEGEYDIAIQKDKTLKATLKVVEGDISLAKTNLSYSEIVAPLDGIICDIPVNAGDLATVGKKLLEIENQKVLVVSLRIPQVDMKYIKLGKKVFVLLKDKRVEAEVSKIYPALGENRMMRIEASLPQNAQTFLLSGQYVKTTMPVKQFKDVLIVPSGVLNIKNDGKKEKTLFILNRGILKQQEVHLLADNEIEAAIEGDIHTGDKVVTGAFLAWAELADGIKAESVK
jgi:RND family efflux transporter MFP subunit